MVIENLVQFKDIKPMWIVCLCVCDHQRKTAVDYKFIVSCLLNCLKLLNVFLSTAKIHQELDP